MAVTADTQPAIYIAMIAGIGGVQVDYAFLKQDEPLRGLECGAGWIGSHEGTVEQRPGVVVHQCTVILATLPPNKKHRVVGGHRHHAEYLACSRLDGHHGAAFACHEAFGILLQPYVEA